VRLDVYLSVSGATLRLYHLPSSRTLSRTSAKGGFPPVRFRACNLESGHSVYRVAGPIADRLHWDVTAEKRTVGKT
jgi:hypothetical protein